MRIKKILVLAFTAAFLHLNLRAQQIPLQNIDVKNTPQINYVFNRIFNGNLDLFYKRLISLQKSDSGVISIVHIGDSHIQADFFSGVIRRGLQKTFGNAGRGLVFPYRLAKSNAPADISSFSNTTWQYNRLAHPEIQIAAGISGFCIQTDLPGATINFTLKPDENSDQAFKNLKFFIDDIPSTSWRLNADSSKPFYKIENTSNDSLLYHEVKLDTVTNSFLLSLSSVDTMRSFYGVTLENDKPGIIYHAIGVNGARYDEYNNASLFWQQLPALKADIFIISLGTNEAQNTVFDEREFIKQVTFFLQKLKVASPDASILITTPADSYKGDHSNKILRQLNAALYNYCIENNIAVWDLYRITNGYGSAHNWLKRGLLSKDRIHFTAEGYRLQAQLFLNALEKGFNTWSGAY